MTMQDLPLGFTERVTFQLRSLYNRHGYSQYKMNKFEEYDLYARNKDFLISDSVITFTDLNGKLMALKPDVTLSIVRSSWDDARTVQKLYYNENVYRAAKGTRTFQEIVQVGLEALGPIDEYCIAEVLTLAAESLRSISPRCLLNISHLGILNQAIDRIGLPENRKPQVLKFIGEKNIHELTAFCSSCGISEEKAAPLLALASLSGGADEVLPRLRALLPGCSATQQLARILSSLDDSVKAILRLDFSAVDDIHYYNGIVFKGFIDGLPGSVLSGGQYDNLMKKMHRRSGAIGFAIYMDKLQQLDTAKRTYDADNLLVYAPGETFARIRAAADILRQQGESVLVQPGIPENARFRRIVTTKEVLGK